SNQTNLSSTSIELVEVLYAQNCSSSIAFAVYLCNEHILVVATCICQPSCYTGTSALLIIQIIRLGVLSGSNIRNVCLLHSQNIVTINLQVIGRVSRFSTSACLNITSIVSSSSSVTLLLHRKDNLRISKGCNSLVGIITTDAVCICIISIIYICCSRA